MVVMAECSFFVVKFVPAPGLMRFCPINWKISKEIGSNIDDYADF